MDILGELPVEISQLILSFLSPEVLFICSKVSKYWRSLVDCVVLWHQNCLKRGWKNVDFIRENRTHFSRSVREQVLTGPLWPLNEWALTFRVLDELPRSWKKGTGPSYLISGHDAPVSCFHSDGHLLAIGHFDGQVSIVNVRRVPFLVAHVTPILKEYHILGIWISKDHLILIQSMLLQMYARTGDDQYHLVDAKSFELGFSYIEVLQRFKSSDDTFEMWYKNQIGGDKYNRERISSVIYYAVSNCLLYAGIRDNQMIYVWSLLNGKRMATIHIPNRLCKLRDMVFYQEKIYIIYASRDIRHITVYDVANEKFIFEVTTPEYRTQKVIIDDFLVGVAIAGPGLTSPGVLTVWNKDTGKMIAIKRTRYVSFNRVASVYGLVIYGEGTTVNVWDPVADCLLRSFSLDELIVSISVCPYTYLLVHTDRSSWLADWVQRYKLYRFMPQIQNSGDYRHLTYSDQTMLLMLVDGQTVEMIAFC